MIDKIQLSISRTKIKGALVFNEGGGYSDMFILAYIGSGHFLGFKILNLTIFGGFPKNEYFRGHRSFVDIFLGQHKNGLYLWVISMYFRIFS